MITCYIVDDEAFSVSILTQHIVRTPGLILSGSETNPLQALEDITGGSVPCQLAFLDIDMPELSGLELRPCSEIKFILFSLRGIQLWRCCL
jgi:DNA-binding LytR/AlgR family response regulator